MRKWTKQSAEEYIQKAEKQNNKGLTYLSAKDFLKHHRTMNSIL